MNELDRVQQNLKAQWLAKLEAGPAKDAILLAQDGLTFRRPILGGACVLLFHAIWLALSQSTLPFLSLACVLCALAMSLHYTAHHLLGEASVKAVVRWIQKKAPRSKRPKWQLEVRDLDALASVFSVYQLQVQEVVQFMTYQKKGVARKNVMMVQVVTFLALSYLFSLFSDAVAAYLIGIWFLTFPFVERLAVYHTYMPKARIVANNVFGKIAYWAKRANELNPIKTIVYDPANTVAPTNVYTPRKPLEDTDTASAKSGSTTTTTATANSDPSEDLTQSVTTARRQGKRGGKVNLSATVTPTAPARPFSNDATPVQRPPPYSESSNTATPTPANANRRADITPTAPSASSSLPEKNASRTALPDLESPGLTVEETNALRQSLGLKPFSDYSSSANTTKASDISGTGVDPSFVTEGRLVDITPAKTGRAASRLAADDSTLNRLFDTSASSDAAHHNRSMKSTHEAASRGSNGFGPISPTQRGSDGQLDDELLAASEFALDEDSQSKYQAREVDGFTMVNRVGDHVPLHADSETEDDAEDYDELDDTSY